MNQRFSASARVLAAIALVGGAFVLIAVVATSLDGGGGEGTGGRSPAVQMGKQGSGKGQTPKSYVVQNGDTLTSIARKTGVSVAAIQTLNPGVDPQILVSGEKLKLR